MVHCCMESYGTVSETFRKNTMTKLGQSLNENVGNGLEMQPEIADIWNRSHYAKNSEALF